MEKIWVIAADNARARLFQAEHITGPITEVRDIVNPEARLQDRELLADASGRSASSGGSGLAAYDEASEKQHQSQLFARDVVDEIEKLRSAGELERFHVLAQPEF
ncbi:MAG TPA: host attachment protein, partial [Gammaproteobacteria bacterium]